MNIRNGKIKIYSDTSVNSRTQCLDYCRAKYLLWMDSINKSVERENRAKLELQMKLLNNQSDCCSDTAQLYFSSTVFGFDQGVTLLLYRFLLRLLINIFLPLTYDILHGDFHALLMLIQIFNFNIYKSFISIIPI